MNPEAKMEIPVLEAIRMTALYRTGKLHISLPGDKPSRKIVSTGIALISRPALLGRRGQKTPQRTGRRRWTDRTGLQIFIAAGLLLTASSSTCRAQVTPQPSPGQPLGQEIWRNSMSRTPLPKHGCFHASYPSTEWIEVPCVAAPAQHRPARGPRPDNVGNGDDYLAQVSGGLIGAVLASFPFAYNAYQTPLVEMDSVNGPNSFSLQLNTNTFQTDLCGATPYPQCAGWEQFVFDNLPQGQYFSGVYIQNWLLYAGTVPPCPPSWTAGNADSHGCFRNSMMMPVPPVAITDLDELTLNCGAQAITNTDSILLGTGGVGGIYAMEQDSVLNLSQSWSSAEFNVFGNGSLSQAVFSSGSVIAVQAEMFISNGTVSCLPPDTIGGNGSGYTGETNNLNLMPPCLVYGLPGGVIEFVETNAAPQSAPSVSTGSASTVGMTSAALNGTVNPSSYRPAYMPSPLTWFQYSTSGGALDCTSPTLTQPQYGGEILVNLPSPINATISGLSSDTTYYFVACALPYWGGLVQGSVANFTTSGITSPTPGITLSGSLANFNWTAVSGATEYELDVGTTPNGTDIFSGTTAGTSQIVGSIPCADTAGGPIYVQLSALGLQQGAAYTYTCELGLGNYNGDGHQDVLWQNNTTHQVTLQYFDGTEGVTYTGWNWLNSAGEPSGWQLVGAADFDGNGVPDLVWEYMPTGQVTVNYYSGPGGTTLLGWNWLNQTGNPGWTVVAVADMNGDGVPDLIWQDNTTNQVTVNYYGGTGGATLIGWDWLNSGGEPAGWHVVAAADFDGNGTPDLVWQYTPTRQVTVNYYAWIREIPLTFLKLTGWNWLNSNGDLGWTVVGANDFNGDGVPDLVWQNDATGQATVNYYGGAGGAVYQGWNWLAATGYPGWTAVLPR